MHRPYMFGQGVIGDLDKAHVPQTWANFDAFDIAEPGVSMIALQAAPNESVQHDTLIVSTQPTLRNNFNVGIGVSCVGTDPLSKHFFEYSAHISFFSAAIAGMGIQLCLGRLASAPSITADVVVANPIFLPTFQYINGSIYAASANGIFINQFGIDGGVLPGTFNPYGLFWKIANDSGGLAIVSDLEISLSLHKYIRDLVSFEPSRG